MGAQSKTRAFILASFPALVSLGLFSWLISSGKWNLFGIWTLDSTIGLSTGFGDLAFLTGVSDCFMAENAGATVDLNSCDPYGRPYTPYGFIPGKVLAFLNLGLANTGHVGIFLMLVWVSLIFFLAYLVMRAWERGLPEKLIALAAITLIAISPSAMLAVERGTIDIVVSALAALGLIGLSRHSRLVSWGSSALLFIAVIIKYFAVGIFVPAFAPRRWSIAATIGAIATLGFLFANLNNLRLAKEVAMADTLSTSRIMFSSTTGLVTVVVSDPLAFAPPNNQVLNETLLTVIGIAIFVAITLVLLVVLRGLKATEKLPAESWYLIVGGSLALAIPYFLGPSNDYRLILLILPLTGLLIWLGKTRDFATRTLLWIVSAATVVAALTGAAMVPNESGFILPKLVLVLGDAALAVSLAFGVALYLNAWLTQAHATKQKSSVPA